MLCIYGSRRGFERPLSLAKYHIIAFIGKFSAILELEKDTPPYE